MKNKILEVVDYLQDLQDTLNSGGISNPRFELIFDPFEYHEIFISYDEEHDFHDEGNFIYFKLSTMEYINHATKNQTWEYVMSIMNRELGEFKEMVE